MFNSPKKSVLSLVIVLLVLIFGGVFIYRYNTRPIDQPVPYNTDAAEDSRSQDSGSDSATPSIISKFFSGKKTLTSTPTPRITSSVTSTPGPTATPTSSPGSPTDPCASLSSNTSYDSTIIDDIPVAYFTLTETTGACDHTTNNRDGTISALAGTTTLPNGDTAAVFDGVQSYAAIPDNDAFSVPTTGKITVEAWMRPDTLQFDNEEGSGYVHWMGKGESGNQEYLTRMYSLVNAENRPNRISGYAFNASGGLGVGSYFQDSITAGQWIHVVLVINVSDTSTSYPMGYSKIYKNGAQRDIDTLATLSIVPVNGNSPFRIGTRDFNSFFKGAIGKVAIYNYELSPYQILEHYQKMVPLVPGTANHIQNIGRVSTKTAGTTMQITVPSTVPTGHTLIARVLTDYSASAATITDSRGNVYTRDRTAPNTGNTMRAAIFSSPITTALQAGDTITITSPSVAARTAVIDEFSGLLTSSFVDQQNGSSGSSTTPGSSISITTTQANELIVGFAGVEGPAEDVFSEDSLGQYTSLSREGTEGGTDNTNLTNNSAFKSVSTIGTYSYRPTLDPTRNWILFVVSYKAL